ncbi:hypothetical protein Naga_100928g4, partial [Nannochloropsis gaditana]
MQQAWLFLLDTSTSMGDPYAHPALLDDLPSSIQVPPPSKLQVAQEIVTLLVAAQAVAESGRATRKCQIGACAFGTDETSHPLEALGAGYENLLEVSPLHPLDFGRLLDVLHLPPSRTGVKGDILAGLILAVDRLKARTEVLGKRCHRHLVVVTDACSALREVEGLEVVVEQVGG